MENPDVRPLQAVRVDPLRSVEAGSTLIDVYPGDGDWTRLFSDIVGPERRVYSFVPAEVAHFKNDPVGRMRALAKEPGRENVDVVAADIVAMPEIVQPADVVWLHLFYHDLHTALIQARGATAAGFNRAVYEDRFRGYLDALSGIASPHLRARDALSG